jgi:DNA anti-recombination protein RmuC
MSRTFNSELEKSNLEVHVDMERQRYSIMSEKVEKMDEQLDTIISDLDSFRNELSNNVNKMRQENAESAHSTNKLFVGAAATIIAGLLSTIVVLLVAFM